MTELAMPEHELWTLTPLHGGEAIRDQANWVGGAQSMHAAEEAASV